MPTVDGAIMFIEMSESTSIKEKETEINWTSTFGWFFTTIRNHIHDSHGTIVKYLGDGAMVFYDTEYVAQAINAAIKIQEYIYQANCDNIVSISCAIGISQGRMHMFEVQEKGCVDYIGNVVDRSAFLTSVASPRAILVDENVINAAILPQVSSQRGRLSLWGVHDYIVAGQWIRPKSFSRSIAYYEIKWGDQIYDVKRQYDIEKPIRAMSTHLVQCGPPGSSNSNSKTKK